MSPSLLLAGVNVVAVEVHQGAVDSSYISFDLKLRLSDEPLPEPVLAI